jgi:dihydrofolate reductase
VHALIAVASLMVMLDALVVSTAPMTDHIRAGRKPQRSRDKPQSDKEKEMGKIVITEGASLDGVVEDPGGFGDFKHAGWGRAAAALFFTWSLGGREAAEQFKLDETPGTKALLLGRVTYEEFAAAWATRDDELADKFNSLPKYVVSSTIQDPEWNNSTVLDGDVVKEVSRLKRELDGDIVVYGSLRLARTLIEHDLVDELRLMVYPVLLGAGQRLFGELPDKKAVRLMDMKTVADGMTILIYETVRHATSKSDAVTKEARARRRPMQREE